MAHCNLCNKNTRCSCKGGGCPNCGASNKEVAFMNDLLKFGVDKQHIRDNLATIKGYAGKVDAYSTYEYITGAIDEEKFNEAMANYKTPKKASYVQRKTSEVVDTTGRVNPDRTCVFKGNSPWDRCIYCNSIRKYMKDQECLKHNKNIVSTDAENK